MRRILLSTAIWFSAIGLSAPTVFNNGRIRLSGSQSKVYDWLAVDRGHVVDYGTGRTFYKLKPARVVDLKGQFVLPGLVDAHAHLVSVGQEASQVNLRGARSADEAVERVRAFLAKNPNADPIVGNGWDQSDWPGKAFPTRAELDSVSLTKSIVLYRVDGHAAWANTIALKASHIWEQTKDPAGGKIYRGTDNQPSGVLVDKAMGPLSDLEKAPSDESLAQYIKATVDEAVSYGITGLHDAGATVREINMIRSLLASKRVRFRFYEMILEPDEPSLNQFLEGGVLNGIEDGQLTVRSAKLFMDGAMGSRGAAFDQPYSDEPGNSGLIFYTEADLVSKIKALDAKGLQIAVHAIGDKANRVTLDAFEKVYGKNIAAKRPRLEHAQVLTGADIARIGKLGVIASMQPVHCTSDMKWVVDRIGPERAKRAYAWKSLLDAKAILAFGSDAPVESLNPWPGLFAAVTRQDESLLPPNGFYPEQRISLAQAMSAFTEGAAYAAFSEKEFGTLEKGKWGDFFVVKEDPFKVSSSTLRETKVAATFIAGQQVYPKVTSGSVVP